MVRSITTGTYGVAKFVVSPDPTQGNYSTISSAIAAASAGDTIYIRDGIYVEDLTLVPDIDLVAINLSGFTDAGNVVVQGKASLSVAGSVKISGLTLETNGDYAISVTGVALSEIELFGCNILGSDFIALEINTTNAASGIKLNYGSLTQNTVATAPATVTGGTFQMAYSTMLSDFTQTVVTNARFRMEWCIIFGNFLTAGTGSIQYEYSVANSGGVLPFCTTVGTGGINCLQSRISAGAATSIQIGAGTTCNMTLSQIDSTAASGFFVQGTGNFNYALDVLTSTAVTIDPGLTSTAYATV